LAFLKTWHIVSFSHPLPAKALKHIRRARPCPQTTWQTPRPPPQNISNFALPASSAEAKQFFADADTTPQYSARCAEWNLRRNSTGNRSNSGRRTSAAAWCRDELR